jgi:hypothetical protein
MRLVWLLLALWSQGVWQGFAQDTVPRVALLFVARGSMPLEPAWRALLDSTRGARIPQLTPEQWSEVMEDQRVAALKRQLDGAGELTASSRIQNADCIDNDIIQARP